MESSTAVALAEIAKRNGRGNPKEYSCNKQQPEEEEERITDRVKRDVAVEVVEDLLDGATVVGAVRVVGRRRRGRARRRQGHRGLLRASAVLAHLRNAVLEPGAGASRRLEACGAVRKVGEGKGAGLVGLEGRKEGNEDGPPTTPRQKGWRKHVRSGRIGDLDLIRFDL